MSLKGGRWGEVELCHPLEKDVQVMSQEGWSLQILCPLKGYGVPDLEEIYGGLQSNTLFEAGPVKTGWSGLCIVRFE